MPNSSGLAWSAAGVSAPRQGLRRVEPAGVRDGGGVVPCIGIQVPGLRVSERHDFFSRRVGGEPAVGVGIVIAVLGVVVPRLPVALQFPKFVGARIRPRALQVVPERLAHARLHDPPRVREARPRYWGVQGVPSEMLKPLMWSPSRRNTVLPHTTGHPM